MGGLTAAISRLLALPEGKRAIEPYSFAYGYWTFNSDKGITGSSGGQIFYTNQGVGGLCTGVWSTPWANNGLSLGKAAWNKVLDAIGNSGGVIDWLFADVEIDTTGNGDFTSFTITGINGLTAAFARNSNYTQSWNGVTSLSGQLAAEGATIGKINLPAAQSYDYVVWNKSVETFRNKLIDKVLWEPTVARYPSAQGSNYDAFYSGSTSDAPPDLNGHPEYRSNMVGNATSPVLYGEIGDIETAWQISTTDSTRLLPGATTNPVYTVSRSPWSSFLITMQKLRSAKRNAPNIPLTPWIASPLYTGGGVTFKPPPVGFADVNAGWNANVGQTYSAAGNSAYYYELVRHAALHGVKAFGYFNDYGTNPNGITAMANLLNDVLTEVNSKTGGFTLGVASVNTSRVDWLSKYIISGSPDILGLNYWWRVTVKPNNKISVNGIELQGTAGNIGVWINTTSNTPPSVIVLNDTYNSFFSDTGSFLGLYSQSSKTLKIYSVNYSTNPVDTILTNTLNLSSIPFSGASNEKCLISDNGNYAIISCPNNKSVYFFDVTSNTLLQTITENQTLFGSLIAADKDFYGLSISTTELNRAPTAYDVRSTSWSVSTKIHYYKRNFNSFNTQKFKKVHSSVALGLMKKSGLDSDTILAFSPTGFPQFGYGDFALESSQSLDAGVYRYSDLVCKKYNFASAILGLKQDQINYKSSFFNIDSPRYTLLTSTGFTMDTFYGKSNQARMVYNGIQDTLDGFDPLPTDAQCISIFTMTNLPAVKQFSITRKLDNNEIIDDKSYQTLSTIVPMGYSRNVSDNLLENTTAGLTYFNQNIVGSFNEKTFIRGLLGLRIKTETAYGGTGNVKPVIDEQVLNTKIAINDTHTYHISQILTASNIKNIRIYRFLNTGTDATETYSFEDYIKPNQNTLSQPTPDVNTIGMIKIMYASSDATALENTFFNNSTMTSKQKALLGVVATKPFLANPSNCPSSEFAYPISQTILNDTITNIFASNDYVFVNFITTTLIFKIDNSLSYKPLKFQGSISSLSNYNFTYNSSGEIFSTSNEIYKYNSTTNTLILLKTIN